MQSDPTIRPGSDKLGPGSLPPLLGSPQPPLMAPAPLTVNAGSATQLLRIVLSLCLVLFLADGLVSLLDNSLSMIFDRPASSGIGQVLTLIELIAALLVYSLMALTPKIPKLLFLPVVLFSPFAGLCELPILIYFYNKAPLLDWSISLCQLILGFAVLRRLQPGFKIRWPLIAENQLCGGGFNWLNLTGFVLVNVMVVLPAIVVYVAFCASLAVDHLSEGFLALGPHGLTVQVRKYIRPDGKTIQLVPMSHVGEPEFYRELTRAFPTNSTILMEGVSDENHLLTNRISYKRMASSLGLAPQERAFRPPPLQMISADIDIREFSTNTIDFLNLVMLVHSKGINRENVLKLLQYSPPPHFEKQLLDDLLRKRNHHLLRQIQAQLADSDYIIVPWGAAHMPEIAQQIQKSGFRLNQTQEYLAIRFHNSRKSPLKADDSQESH